MSTYYDFHCRTCNKDCGIDNARCDEAMVLMLKHRAAFVGLAEAVDDFGCGCGLGLEFSGLGGYCWSGLPEFFRKHAGHDVAVQSEYGSFHDECGEWIARVAIPEGNAHFCTLPVGHAGEHASTRKA